MNIFACILKMFLVIFSNFFRVPHKFYLFFKKSFFLRVLNSDYHGKMSSLSFSWIIIDVYIKIQILTIPSMKLFYKTKKIYFKDWFSGVLKNIIALLYKEFCHLFDNHISSSCFMLIALLRIFRTMANDNDDSEYLVCLLLPMVLIGIPF